MIDDAVVAVVVVVGRDVVATVVVGRNVVGLRRMLPTTGTTTIQHNQPRCDKLNRFDDALGCSSRHLEAAAVVVVGEMLLLTPVSLRRTMLLLLLAVLFLVVPDRNS